MSWYDRYVCAVFVVAMIFFLLGEIIWWGIDIPPTRDILKCPERYSDTDRLLSATQFWLIIAAIALGLPSACYGILMLNAKSAMPQTV